VVLAETLGSCGAAFTLPEGYRAVGLDINANHLRGATSGWVTGIARAGPRAELRRAALEYHEFPTPARSPFAATKQMINQRDLALAYSPGVAAPAKRSSRTRPTPSSTPAAATWWPWSPTAPPCWAWATSARWPPSR
jgi:hypothetical protein